MNTLEIEQRLKEWSQRRPEIIRVLRANGCLKELPQRAAQTFFPLRASSLKTLKVAVIMDLFSLESFSPECVLLELTPEHWKEEAEVFQPDLLFIESAWQGKGGLWYHKIDRYSRELEELTAYFRKKHIPIIFWNKEDPAYTASFLIAASYADVVFTTDVDCIAKYKAELGHNRVYHLHFAAQPQFHNPLEKYERKDKFCFAGAYYHKYKERSEVFDRFAETFLSGKGLDIYDRNYPNPPPEYAFPAQYKPHILGTLSPEKIDVAYKGYSYGINMNSIQQSQSMFARRVFEMLASNTVTVGNFSRGVKNYFGDLTVSTDDAGALSASLERWCGSAEKLRKYRLLGLRKVLSEDLYEDRLGYITEKVYGKNLKQEMPLVTALAFVKSEAEARRAERMFLSQTFQNKRLAFIGNLPEEQTRGYQCFDGTEASQKKISQLCPEGFVTVLDSRDWYGPNYLTDLTLSLRYGNWRGVGKTARYVGQNGVPVARNLEAAYRPTEALELRRGIARADILAEKRLSELNGAFRVKGDALLGIDEFNYCENWRGESCPEAEDMVVADKGLPLAKIEQCAQNISPLQETGDVLHINGSEFSQISATVSRPVTFISVNGQLRIESRLDKDVHAYVYMPGSRIEVEPWLVNGKLPVQFRGGGGLDLICVVVCYNESGKKLKPLYPRLNHNELLELPDETRQVQLGFRVKGSGAATVKEIIIGSVHEVSDRCCFLSRSNALILTNHYPSYDALYRNMFVHARMTAYKEQGRVFDVMRMYPYSEDGFREFEGINILEGKGGELMNILDSGSIDTVCVHFLDEEMWEVLKPYIREKKIRLLVWLHGAEIQPWWRRTYNYKTERDLAQGKQQSEIRMAFWAKVFEVAKDHENIHFIAVSQYFMNEICEDNKIRLNPTQYSIIHNLIDTDKFVYEKKPAEQRKKVLTIKPFASNKYANDLTTRGILELSKRPCFQDMEIDIYGQGELFDEINRPLRKFPNVFLHKKFLLQSEIASIHKLYGVYIGTTRMDAQGVSRDEAMSSGLVPIANNCTAIPEFVDDDCGILIPPESYVELADALERLYNDPALFERLSENAAKRVRGQSSREFTIDRELKLIEGEARQ